MTVSQGAHYPTAAIVGRGGQHRHALARQAFHHLEHLADQLWIERRGRFVEQHQPQLHGQRPGDGDALLPAARQARRIGHKVRGSDCGPV